MCIAQTMNQLVTPLNWESNGANIQMDSISTWCAYTGQSYIEVVNWGWLKAVHSEDYEQVLHAWEKALEHTSTFFLEYRIRHYDGAYQVFKVQHVPNFTDEHHLAGWTCVFTNFSSYTPIKDEELESRLFYRLIFDQASVGIFNLTLDGCFLRVNKEFCHIVGYSEKELLGMPIQSVEIPQDYHITIDLLASLLLQTERTIEVTKHYRRKDGSLAWVKLSATLMYLPSGEPNSYLVIVDDITAQVMANQQQQQMEQRVKKAYSSLLIWAEEMVQLPTQLEQYSHTEKLSSVALLKRAGYHLAELTKQILECQFVGVVLIDQKTDKLQLVELVGLPATIVEQIRRNASPSLSSYFSDEAIAHFYANEVVYSEFLPMPFRYRTMTGFSNMLIAPMLAEGKLVGLFGVKKGSFESEGEEGYQYTQEDISLVKVVAKLALLFIEREQFQHEWLQSSANELVLLETNRRFDEFISIASHELRTPLTTIKGNIQLAQRRMDKMNGQENVTSLMTSKQFKRIQMPLLQAEHRVNVLNRLISDLLDVSRIQANEFMLVMHHQNLAEIVRNAVEDQRFMTPERTIDFDVPENVYVPVIADTDRIGQVVDNLLTNALKYSPPDSSVRVSLQYDEQSACVSVIDHGTGIAVHEQQRLWQRFYRVKGIEPQSDSGAGLGLGLHINRTIIEHHHGNVGVDSAPGKGSTFWFSLPRAQ
jgi:PAS domain S-box-containing protein